MAVDTRAKRVAVLEYGYGSPYTPTGTVDLAGRSVLLGLYDEGAAPPADPHMVLTPSTLTFGAVVDTTSPAPRDSVVSNSGGGSLTPSLGSITYLDGSGWLSMGIVGDTITATVDITGLAIGTYRATVPVIDAGADNTPQTLTIVLRIQGTSSSAGFWTVGASGTGASRDGGDGALAWPSATYDPHGGAERWG